MKKTLRTLVKSPKRVLANWNWKTFTKYVQVQTAVILIMEFMFDSIYWTIDYYNFFVPAAFIGSTLLPILIWPDPSKSEAEVWGRYFQTFGTFYGLSQAINFGTDLVSFIYKSLIIEKTDW